MGEPQYASGKIRSGGTFSVSCYAVEKINETITDVGTCHFLIQNALINTYRMLFACLVCFFTRVPASDKADLLASPMSWEAMAGHPINVKLHPAARTIPSEIQLTQIKTFAVSGLIIDINSLTFAYLY